MSWVTVIWSMIASACLTLAAVHALLWWRRREAWANVLFAVTAIATTLMAAGEMWMMRSETPAQFATAVRWTHVPAFAITVSLLGFVLLYLHSGRRWLAWAVCGVRALSLILNFLTGVNLNYRAITSLRHIPFLGEPVSIAVGISNPWMLVGQFSLALLLVFVADAAITVWRRGDRRQALVVGGGMLLFILMGSGESALALWGVIAAPVISSLFFLGIVAAMGFELSRDMLRAVELSDELRQSEERMILAAEAANLAVWVWNIAQDEIWMTPRGRAFFGFAPDARLDCASMFDRVHPEDRDARDAAVMRAIAARGQYETEYRVLAPEGGLRWIAARGRYFGADGGHPARLVGVSLDVTAQKRAQESLRESEARFRTMADSAPVMIWMSGTDKLCTFFSKGWLDFSGRTLEQESGNGWAEGVHREDLDRCLTVYAGSFDARKPFEMEYRLRRKDGEYRWILDIGTPRFAVDGAFLGYIGSCIDITARRLAEDAARNLGGRLIQAQEEAQRQLACELHDDFSQSLAMLSIELEMFGQNPPSEPKKITEGMEAFSTRVKELASEVHQLSHDLHPAKLEQLGLVAAVRGFCKELAQTHEIAIEFSERNVPRMVPSDLSLCLYRVAQEALHNVLKHSDATTARVELAREDGYLRLVVADDGGGFDPQSQRANATLGLVSMSERARFVGGRLSIESQPGAGVRLEVCVPFFEDPRHSSREFETEAPAFL